MKNKKKSPPSEYLTLAKTEDGWVWGVYRHDWYPGRQKQRGPLRSGELHHMTEQQAKRDATQASGCNDGRWKGKRWLQAEKHLRRHYQWVKYNGDAR